MWVLTGSTGQLGSALKAALTRLSIDFIGLSHKEFDICDSDSRNVLIQLKPSAIINCAAWTDVEGAETNETLAFKVNEMGARNMAKVAQELNIPLIHISTDYVFSGLSETPWLVNSPREPLSIYGSSKLAGEIAVQEVHPYGSYILRTSWLYSRWGKNFAKTILKSATKNREVTVVDDQSGQPTAAADLASRIIELLTSKIKPGTYHGTNSGETTWYGFAQEIYRLSGKDVNLVRPIKSAAFASSVKRPSYSVLDHSNWQTSGLQAMRPWKDALRDDLPYILNEIERESARG
jgi:dTDP-4-dehydrorhamnose reductase